MVDPGPVITPPGQYTHCVDRHDYQDVPGVLDVGIPAMLEFLLCNYLLGGKLVCLAGGGDECAIGTVVGLEAVGEGKTGINALDNDFSFNVFLAPFEAQDIARAYGPPSSPLARPQRGLRRPSHRPRRPGQKRSARLADGRPDAHAPAPAGAGRSKWGAWTDRQTTAARRRHLARRRLRGALEAHHRCTCPLPPAR